MARARRTTVDMSQALAGLDKVLQAKESLARTMGAAMGMEVRDEAKIRAPVLQPGNEGVDGQVAGTLRDAIYVAYDERRAQIAQETFRYTVSWNASRAPHGHLLEFGHWMPFKYAKTADGLFYTPTNPAVPNPADGADGFWVAAEPFLGPAFDTKMPVLMQIAVQAGRVRFQELSG